MEDKSVKLTFDFGSRQIIIEGKGDELVKLILKVKSLIPHFSEIRIIDEQKSAKPQVISSQPTTQLALEQNKGSLRQFAKSLSLSNTYERIAAIAYYAIKIEGKSSFTVKEMGDWFGLCGFQKPAVMPVALSDAKRKYGYVESKGRDQWVISTAGENKIMELKEK